jgi:prolyl-tRNA synthetase
MRYSEIPIQTHRENPANARTEGAALLVRAGYVSHAGELLPLGKLAIKRIQSLAADRDFLSHLGMPLLSGADEIYFPLSTGSTELLHCPSCGYASRLELARAQKAVFSSEPPAALEKVLTPDCPTIEALAAFLGVPQEKTAKALMFVRKADEKFVFVVVRGDMVLSEAKLKNFVGEIRLATEDEIQAAGAVPGYASPLEVRDALIVVDDLIPQSPNLVSGANDAGYHVKNVNYGRDYSADIVADLTLAQPGDLCIECSVALQAAKGWILASKGVFDFEKILSALAETHYDEKGLTLPAPVAPFNVYLMHVPGKTLDTRPAAGELYENLQAAGFSVLFDDRDERAGVKFNDADLIGSPIRITVGERGLQNGMVEVKFRREPENKLVLLTEVALTLRKH